jgi:CspA family cold shock protein
MSQESGVVKFFDVAKGFGFIVPDVGDKDIYFNRASLPLDRRYEPVQGDSVQFETRPATKGVMAVRVQITI